MLKAITKRDNHLRIKHYFDDQDTSVWPNLRDFTFIPALLTLPGLDVGQLLIYGSHYENTVLSMKAIEIQEFGGAEVLRLGDIDVPAPAAGQVLIRVAATSVNRPDIVQREGNYPPPPGDSEILGLEVAGTIEEFGPDTDPGALKTGDRVAALVGGGGYAEYVVAHVGHCFHLPENVSFEAGACLCETYITAYLNVIELGGLQDNESVLLHGGGGGVNTSAIQIVAALRPGAEQYVTASSGKVERVRALGVGHVIDYKKTEFADEIRVLTAKKGVDVILDHIGAPYLQANLKSLALSGRLVLIGVMGGIKSDINLAALMVKRQQIIGSVLRSRPVPEKSAIIARYVEAVMPHVEASAIRPLISDTLPLADAAEGHRLMESGKHFGKIVLSVNS